MFAMATDENGATAISNTARITAGLENLAAGKTVEASSGRDSAKNIVDGRLWSDWPSDENDDSPWIAVDLEVPRKVGAVALLWGRAYPESYSIQVATERGVWRDIFSTKTGTGDAAAIRFSPVEVRLVRISGMTPHGDRGPCRLYEMSVYESLSLEDSVPVE
jgi:hypothetical protein